MKLLPAARVPCHPEVRKLSHTGPDNRGALIQPSPTVHYLERIPLPEPMYR